MVKKVDLIDFEEQLQACKSSTDLNTTLKHFLKSYSITTFAFTYYSYYPTSIHKQKYDTASENYKTWHQHYIEEGYDDVDSTLNVVYNTILPTQWDLKQQLSEASSLREKQMREDSIKYGIEKGVSIPIHGPKEDFAILLLVQMRGETGLNHFSKIKHELFAAAYYFYHYLAKMIIKESPPNIRYSLTSREMQILILLAKQFSNEDISKKLRITERTVNYHIQRLNKKLGTENKYQSVIKALLKKLIHL